MASTTPIPEHKLSESPNSRSIAVGDWTVTARTNPISNAVECDALQIALLGMPLPEMTFGNNSLELKHQPSGWNYVFTTLDALKSVKNGELTEGDGGVKVGYADAWLQSRCVLRCLILPCTVSMTVALALYLRFPCQKPLLPNRTIGHTQLCTLAMPWLLHLV